MTSYENICVALWIMFPKADRLHLSGFENMPDTDFMEKLIKLRSMSKDGNYLIGGNYRGRTSEYGLPWKLTSKGQAYANEVEQALKGIGVRNYILDEKKKEIKQANRRGTINYDTQIDPILNSNLFKKFHEKLLSVKNPNEVLPEYTVSAPEICSAFHIYYPSYNLKQKVEEKKKSLRSWLAMVRSDRMNTEKAVALREFLMWLSKRDIDYD